jgi:hypothetical protein
MINELREILRCLQSVTRLVGGLVIVDSPNYNVHVLSSDQNLHLNSLKIQNDGVINHLQLQSSSPMVIYSEVSVSEI